MPWGRHGGYPYSIMLCNITQNVMGQTLGGRGVPCQVRTGGDTLPGGYPGRVTPPARSGREGTHIGYPPARSGWGGTPPRPGQDGGGTQLGQQKEYSLHGGWYASCVQAGGLSCSLMKKTRGTSQVTSLRVCDKVPEQRIYLENFKATHFQTSMNQVKLHCRLFRSQLRHRTGFL